MRRAARFGLAAAFLSSFGQTFFIGLFGPALHEEFGLDPRQWGLLYGVATLASGTLMFWLGALADRLPARQAILASLLLLTLAAALMAAAWNPLVLGLALFGLRLGGQGLTGHVAIVVAARHGGHRRGRTLAIASFGFILGEALLPISFAALLGLVDWRWLWAGVAVFLAAVALPALTRLAAALPAAAVTATGADTSVDIGRLRLLLAPRFLRVLAVALLLPFVITALFLHQGSIAALRGWTPHGVAAGILVFALTQAPGTWLSGRLVDRHGGVRLLPLYLLPAAMGMLALAWLPPQPALWLMFVGLGLSAGASNVTISTVWVELFGTRQVGMIRGVYMGLMVLTTALAPALLGLALAAATPLAALATGAAIYAALVPWLATRGLRPAAPARTG